MISILSDKCAIPEDIIPTKICYEGDFNSSIIIFLYCYCLLARIDEYLQFCNKMIFANKMG